MSAAGFGARLLAWYDAHKRDLPWRDVADPWVTWVSEVMLQQTRVEAVRQSFTRFLARYPDPRAFAAASDDELLLAWRGLGYYRRARLLRDGARAVVERHGGRVPASPRALAALPGVGAYTAAAIASIAFGQPVPAVDGNVERVLARHRGITANVKSGAGARAVREAAAALLVRARAGDFNQALMDLGATLCTAKAPRCAVCPVAEDCVARRSGRQAELPVLPERRAPVDVRTRVALLRAADGAVVVRRIGEREVNRGQLDLPGPGPLEGVPDAAALQAWLDGHLGAGSARIDPEPACEVRHAITWHRIRVAVHVGTLRARRVPAPF
ncbi:MAG TPA: A/G-specific adenine glycosylase, partial [Planctomycetota bacterium]|nr:A/G-specific adenine glycosylase [Planctomycetota bacterium]